MSLGSSFPPGYIEAQVKRQLRPGAVVKLVRIMGDGKPHEKRFVVLHNDVIRDLVKRPEWVLGEITAELRDDIVSALKFARTLSTAEVNVYCESLATLR